MQKVLFSILILLSGCKPQGYSIKNNQFHVTLIESPQYLDSLSTPIRTIHGLAMYQDGRCIIILREYPNCLLHEVRHCIEGDWHPGRDTLEDC